MCTFIGAHAAMLEASGQPSFTHCHTPRPIDLPDLLSSDCQSSSLLTAYSLQLCESYLESRLLDLLYLLTSLFTPLPSLSKVLSLPLL